MITEDYVSFETAKLLKEKGFNESTPVNYFVGDDKPRGCAVGEMIYHKRLEEDTHLIACPTLQMAMKWLREVHNIIITVRLVNSVEHFCLGEHNQFTVDIATTTMSSQKGHIRSFYLSYEEACEAAIKYCLENLI